MWCSLRQRSSDDDNEQDEVDQRTRLGRKTKKRKFIFRMS